MFKKISNVFIDTFCKASSFNKLISNINSLDLKFSLFLFQQKIDNFRGERNYLDD